MIDIECFSPDVVWAILPRTLDLLVRNHERVRTDEMDVNAFVSTRGLQVMEGTRFAGRRGNVAVLPIIGPIFSRGRYSMMAQDLGRILEADDIEAVVLDIDSPGGIVDGTQEFSDLIRDSDKWVVAHVGGMGASAAYWIASAANEIVMTPTASVGSIGVMATYIDWTKFDERVGIQEINIVSNQSPLKNAPPTTDVGMRTIQARVDELAQIFIENVAKNRNVSASTVLKDFGQGDLVIGERAVSAGLADRLGSFDEVLSALTENSQGGNPMTMKLKAGIYVVSADDAEPKAVTLDQAFLTEQCPDVVKAIGQSAVAEAQKGTPDVDTAVKADRERVQAILGHEHAKGRESLAQHLAFSGMSVEDAGKALEAAPKHSGNADFFAAMNQNQPGVSGEDPPSGQEGQGAVAIDRAAVFANRQKAVRG